MELGGSELDEIVFVGDQTRRRYRGSKNHARTVGTLLRDFAAVSGGADFIKLLATFIQSITHFYIFVCIGQVWNFSYRPVLIREIAVSGYFSAVLCTLFLQFP